MISSKFVILATILILLAVIPGAILTWNMYQDNSSISYLEDNEGVTTNETIELTDLGKKNSSITEVITISVKNDSCTFPAKWLYYFVQQNDDLSTISKKFNVPIVHLLQANCFKNNVQLIPGQMIYIPLHSTEIAQLTNTVDPSGEIPIISSLEVTSTSPRITPTVNNIPVTPLILTPRQTSTPTSSKQKSQPTNVPPPSRPSSTPTPG